MNAYERLIAQLELGSANERRDAFEELQLLANPWLVQPSLINFVLTAKEQHLEWSIEGYDYEQGEGQKSGFTLVKATIDEAWWCVAAATVLLIEYSASSIDVLLPLLEYEKAIVRVWTVFVLGEIGDERAVPHLIDRLNVSHQRELWRVCEALGKLRAVDAVPRLIELLEDEVTGVDSAAATALGQIGDPRALMPLIEQLKKHKSSVYSISAALYHYGEKVVLPLTEVLFDADAEKVHDLALMELGMLKDQRAIRHILRYLDTLPNTINKCAAITALGRLKAEEAVSRIAEIFRTATDFDIRNSSSAALAEIGNRQAIESLLRELDGGTAENQHAAALAFGQLKHIQDIEPLLNALKNGSPNIRSAIAVSLGNLRDRRAITALEEALNDTNKNTRRYAQIGLDKINETNRCQKSNSATE